MSNFYVFGPFLAEKMALEVKKARFNPFVLPSDFFKSDGDPVYSLTGSIFPSELSPPMRQLLKEILNMRNQNGEPVKLGTSGWLQARLGRHLLSA